MEIKTLLSTIAIILTLVAYMPYIRDTISGKTIPHVYTWLIGTIMPYIIFALQLSEGGGVGSWTTFAVGTMGFVIFILSLQRPKKDITRSDTVLLITSFVSIGLWLLLDNPIASATLLIAIGAAAYIPTIRKTYLQPDSETLSTYTINTFRHGLSAFALESYNFVTLINPVIWVVINAIVVGIIVARKKQ